MSATTGSHEAVAKASLQTILVSDLVDSTKLAESLGDRRMADIWLRHDRLARDLLHEHGGREADRTDGFLMLFERPLDAVLWALDFHRAMAELSSELEVALGFRVGIHLGEVVLIETSADDVARGAKPLEVEGLAKPTAARLMSLAQGRQTLLSQAAFDLARRSAVGADLDDALRWVAHGDYLLKGVTTPTPVFEVGLEGLAPLTPPPDTEKVRRVVADESILGWRPAPGLEIPLRPNWRIVEKLGEGGFGEVWLAQHRKTRSRRVFKFCFEADQLRALRREITLFRLLKETLGERDDIARILDWSFDQPPFFVEAEYTAGGSLAQWAEAQGGLEAIDLDTRLELVAQIGDALAAAHSVGVLHKDVKPANVLIHTAGGAPRARLTDFGIGMVTDDSHLVASGITVGSFTELAQSPGDESPGAGTRLYMAPETLEGRPPTVQGDTYALGVILYQMVVGDFRRALAPGWERDVDDPLVRDLVAWAVDGSADRRLADGARLARRLRNLDARRAALEAERQAEEKARQIEEDLARVRRRRRQVLAIAAVLAGLAVALGLVTLRIDQERQRADREATAVRHVTDLLVSLFDSRPGEELLARDVLESGAERVGELEEQPLVEARLRQVLGRSFLSLGEYPSAIEHLDRALDLGNQLGDSAGDLEDRRIELAEAKIGLGTEHYDGATALLEASLESAEKLQPTQQIVALCLLGRIANERQQYDRADELYQQALDLAATTVGDDDPATQQTLNSYAIQLRDQRRLDEAAALFQRLAAARERLFGAGHWQLAAPLHNLAAIQRDTGQLEAAETTWRRNLEIFETTFSPEHPNVAATLTALAILQRRQDRVAEAEPNLRRALTILDSQGIENRAAEMAAYNLAEITNDAGSFEEARSLARRALELQERRLTDPRHPDLGPALTLLADLERRLGNASRAVALENRARDLRPADRP